MNIGIRVNSATGTAWKQCRKTDFRVRSGWKEYAGCIITGTQPDDADAYGRNECRAKHAAAGKA